MLLALDTSTRLAGIALYDGVRGLIAEQNWHSANRHTVELTPRVAQMLAQADATAADLCAVAVALGPGSFTGLRVALAVAKGLALANALTLLGVPTLDVVAYPHSRQPLPVIAVVPAGRGRVCWAPYALGPAGWSPQAPYGLTTVTALAESIDQPTLFAGELAAADWATLAERLGERLAERAYLLPPALSMRRAGYLAEIAWGRFAAGQADDLATLTPIYLHEPAAPAGGGLA
ncbi:MAG: tRNA (adenosine(37)-N6)-threonylcarbamoyltransferase complex dimerization subunit type 1 TsaB [Chloroflexi bacterium HGW-Chloroflexi-1]|nr:MAG: tRNA (adenosine(37)-N6)-threonylcarbamoyltransferase complex dimerization subunit type 1 TsaB [Chloroflexi bacterium HGW-Chloroflexi-1]